MRFSLSLCALALATSMSAKAETLYYSTEDHWNSVSSGDINLSAFTYVDYDRNGKYTVGDRPMPGVQVTLEFGGRDIAVRTSNVNGFANFSASATDPTQPIHDLGVYSYTVHPPPGMSISSANQTQSATLKTVEGSIGGVGFEEMIKPIGLVPDLYIEGSMPVPGAASLSLRHGDQEIATLQTEKDGSFRFSELEPGTYTLRGDDISRDVILGPFPLNIGKFEPASAPDASEPLIANFDDITFAGMRKVPNGYRGLEWFNFNAMEDQFSTNSIGYINGCISEPYIAYSSSGHPASISRDTPFHFHGAYVSTSWLDAQGETLIVEMWHGANKVREDHIQLSIYHPVYYAPEIGNITKIQFSTKHYWQLVLDDVKVSF